MKKFLLSISLLSMFLGVNAQCYKYVVFEHFTQASCGPCAQQNPSFQNNILANNPNTVRHVAFHTSWPGTDHMYNNNSADNGARTSYYAVSGVPYMVMNGNVKKGGPTSFSQADVTNENAKGSPLKIIVTDTKSGTNHTVTIEVKTIGTLPAGNHNLVVELIEKQRTYNSAPGSNGEKSFPNVFLDMLTTATNGQAITLAPQGQSTTVTLNYSETQATLTTLTNPAVNVNNLAVVAFVQNTATKNVVQVGSTLDVPVNATISAPTSTVQAGTSNSASTFNFQVGNSGSASEQFNYALTSTGAPAGWTSSFTVNGNNYTTSGTATVPANTSHSASITVTPNASPGVGKYTLTITSITNPTAPPMVISVYVISGVTDLIVNNTGGFGDAAVSGTPAKFEGEYVTALQFAGCTSYGITDYNVLEEAIKGGAMGSVKSIYMNTAWAFPSFTDGLVAQLTTFLSTPGKCMFISGQDIGWEIMTASNNVSQAIKTFYTTYLNATFVNDGANTTTSFDANASDPIFGTLGNGHNFSTTLYGSGTQGAHLYPDEVNATGNGQVIFKYLNGTKNGAIRATNGTYKVVYLGIGIEQLTSASSKNNIIKTSYDWFNAAVGTLEFDQQMLAIGLGQNYPNPSSSVTYIPMTNVDKNITLQVVDLSGRIVLSEQIVKGTELHILNTESLESGLYLYRLVDNEKTISTKPMQVVK